MKRHAHNLEENDIVFTSYEIVSREVGDLTDLDNNREGRYSPLNIKWKRIVLDEAHRIKNHNSQVSKSVCSLKAKYRYNA